MVTKHVPIYISTTLDLQDRKPLGELPEKKEKLWKDEEHHEKEFLKATSIVILVLWCL